MNLRGFIKTCKNNNINEIVDLGIKKNYLSEILEEFHYHSDENRFWDNELIISNKVFRQDYIKICNAKKIYIKNSIILNDLYVLLEKPAEYIVFEDCIVLGEISISGSLVDRINIVTSNLNKLYIHTSDIDFLGIFLCNIHDFTLRESKIDKLDSSQSMYSLINKYRSYIKDLNSIGDDYKYESIIEGKLKEDFHATQFRSFLPEIGIRDKVKERIETIDFLFKERLLVNNKILQNSARTKIRILSETNPIGKVLVDILQGFTRPSIFILFGILAISLYADYYYFFGSFNFEHIAFKDAIYFSGITFTTIGYGDIHPKGITGLISITEGLLGVFFCSGFLVSLVNKYT